MPANLSGRLTSAFGRPDRLWSACALLAAVLVAVAAWLPLWEMDMHAPQYPQGLTLTAYGTRLEGDIQELNALNHYVGVAPIEPDAIFELRLFPYAVGALVAGLVLGAALSRHRIVRVGLVLAVWGLALGFLIDLQWWLYRAGHELDHDAPMRVSGFTQKVLGTTQVVNFRIETMVAEGFWLIFGAAVLVSFVPAVTRFLFASWRNTGVVPSSRAPRAAGPSQRRNAA